MKHRVLASVQVTALLVGISLLSWTAAYGQITPLGDSYTNTADSTTNYGSATLLYVDAAKEITHLQFNLVSVPTTATITQATLKLYVNSVTNSSAHVCVPYGRIEREKL